jgi:hypothetical protein
MKGKGPRAGHYFEMPVLTLLLGFVLVSLFTGKIPDPRTTISHQWNPEGYRISTQATTQRAVPGGDRATGGSEVTTPS